MKSLAKSKMYTRSEDKDIFFDDFPIRRKAIPDGWKTHLCSWQAKIGLRSLRKIEDGLKKRQRLGQTFFETLSKEQYSLIPAHAQVKNFNFYHLPLKVSSDKYRDLKELFFLGIDSEGYGLNLCSEEKVFEELCVELPNARKVKHESVFIPIHESYSKIAVEKMAKNLAKFDPKIEA